MALSQDSGDRLLTQPTSLLASIPMPVSVQLMINTLLKEAAWLATKGSYVRSVRPTMCGVVRSSAPNALRFGKTYSSWGSCCSWVVAT